MNKCIAGAAVAVALTFASQGSATVLTLNTVTPVGTEFEYSYSGTLGGDEGLVAGSMFVIFDFGDYVAGSVSSGIYAADLVASTQLTTSGLLLPPGATDDPLIPNLVFTWIGANFNAVGGPFFAVDFSGLSARSTSSTVVIGSFSTLTTNNNGFAAGTPVYTAAFTGVPAQSPPSAVPEPATWAMMLLGFGAAGFAIRRRRRTELTMRQIA